LPEQDGSDINHCDATLTPFPDGSQIIATANDDSKIRLFRYPAMVEDQQFVELRGHSSHVTKVRFNKNNSYLFSAGGNDTTVMQWRITQ